MSRRTVGLRRDINRTAKGAALVKVGCDRYGAILVYDLASSWSSGS